ncbi:MAG: hypothetical protein IIY87_05525 [Bacteroidales bacterium]|nr:hypothetical protein [Bacteroidales bacterium]
MDHRNRKKKLIISYKNLTDDVRELFKDAYPDGYKDYLQKTIKPNGEAIFVVPLETEDTSYMIKFDVKIDTGLVDEDLDKDLYGDEEREDSEFAPISEAIDKEEGNDHRVGKLNHGAYEEMFEGLPEDKKEFEMANEDIEDEYGDRPDEDSYLDDDDDDDDDMEPDDDDLLEIEGLLAEADAGEGLLREENPPEEHYGRKKKEPAKSRKNAAEKETKETRGRKPKTEKSAKTATKKAPKKTLAELTKTPGKVGRPPKTTAKAEVKDAKPAKATAKATTKESVKAAKAYLKKK